VRFTVKPFGHRLPKCSAQGFHKKVAEGIAQFLEPRPHPSDHRGAYCPHTRVRSQALEAAAEELYPERRLLREVQGVGPLTALVFFLILEDPMCLANARAVGA
jgi:transposase